MHKAFGAGLLACHPGFGLLHNDDTRTARRTFFRAESPRIGAPARRWRGAALPADLQFAMDSVGLQ